MPELLFTNDAALTAYVLGDAVTRLTASGDLTPEQVDHLAAVRDVMRGGSGELSIPQRELAVGVLGQISEALVLQGKEAQASSLERAAVALTAGTLLIVSGTA